MKSFLRSFVYAAEGIQHCFTKDRNVIIHCIAAIAVTIAGFVFGISRTEWMIICLNIGIVIGFEMLNTSIEKICNLVHPQHHPFVKIIKDVVAGAVLIAAIVAAVCCAIIFIPKIF